MTTEDKGNPGEPFHYEHGVPVFDVHRVDELERAQAASEQRDREYKDEQLTVNKWMMRFTGALVVCAILAGSIAIYQAHIAKLNATAAAENAAAARGMMEEMKKSGGDTHELAVQAGKQATNTDTLAKAAGRQADAAKIQAENTKESLRKSDEAFHVSQQPYLTFGRKDGVIAELKEAKDPSQWVGIFLYLQNAGHLPARTVCISTTTSAFPVMGSQSSYQSNPLIRQRGRESTGKMRVIESGCPTIGGDSGYVFVIDKPFTQQTLNEMKAIKDSDLRVSAVIQYCDSFGNYFCRYASFQYLHDPINGFRPAGELDCRGRYRAVPDTPQSMYGTNEPLPPCSTPEEDKRNQEEYMRSYGWKPIPEPTSPPK